MPKADLKTLPMGAMRFVEVGGDACAFAKTENDVEVISMLAYSGGMIKNHWYWGNFAIDVSGVELASPTFPILEEHMKDRKIAFTKDPILNNSIVINPAKTKFVDSEASKEFRAFSKDGFPYQCSIYAQPYVIEEIEPGKMTEVNGQQLSGLDVVWRKSKLKEASVCVFGWDSETAAKALSEEREIDAPLVVVTWKSKQELADTEGSPAGDVNTLTQKEGEEMELATKKDQVSPELLAQIEKDLKDKLAGAADGDIAKLTTQIETLSANVLTLTTANQELAEGAVKRDKRAMAAEARAIVLTKLAATDIPAEFHEDVQNSLSASKFVLDGELDTEKFSTAADEAITKMETKLTKAFGQNILGTGGSSRQVNMGEDIDPEEFLSEAESTVIHDTTNRLLKLAGQTPAAAQV